MRVCSSVSCSRSAAVVLGVLLSARPGLAQSSGQPAGGRITLPTIVVTAQKEPTDPQTTPVSVTAVTEEAIAAAGLRTISEAGGYSPNTWFTDFSARKLSNARVRGVGSSPLNPGVTTYIDGVPQLNANSSNIELLDVGQIEFVRGPQSPLFGRNALGGVVNVTSRRPSLSEWTGALVAPFGNFSAAGIRGGVAGPLGESIAVSLSLGHEEREGYATNTVTGNDVDFRSGSYGKAQLLWVPTQNWEARVIVSGERDRDGDYRLADLEQVRATPFQVARDFEGHTGRDIAATTVLLRGEGERLSLTSSTGFLSWRTDDATDLDYSPLPLATRTNDEEAFQFTQEVRVASPRNAPTQLSDALALTWQTGVALFTQSYDQSAVNTISPFVFSPLLPVPVAQHSPEASLDDVGVGVFGQGTLTVNDALDVTVGLRFDYEDKEANLRTFYEPPVAPETKVDESRGFSNLSPQAAVAYRFRPTMMAYGSVAQGFKAGGFNPASPTGSESYDEEHAWHIEGGVKTSSAGGRVSANAAVFFIDWSDLQLNVPNPLVPGQFYVANVGGADSRGVEVEVRARPHPHVDLLGSIGYTHARFSSGSRSSDEDVSGNTIPNTPEYTAMIGVQVDRPLTTRVSVYGLAEAVFYGAMQYDELNTEGQDAYSLANFRGGVRGGFLFAEAWVTNAFDTRYIPVAFQYQFARSGFVGEVGRPRTFGVSAGLRF